MRLLWLSNSPLCSTGYGNQTALFAPRLQQLGYPTAVHAFYGNDATVLEVGGLTVYPKFEHPFGQDICAAHAQHFGADAILTLTDAWVMEPQHYQGLPWLAWAPIDHDPAPPDVIAKLKDAAAPIAYSRFGERMMREAGLDPYYVPHGIDTAVYQPIDRTVARRALKWPEDRFVVGMVAANKGFAPCRKAFPEALAAFARLRQKHPDALLYLHTNLDTPASWQPVKLSPLFARFGLVYGRDVVAVDQYQYFCGAIPAATMAHLYSAMDVLLTVSRGEGFGIPALEAQACGTPVITGGWTAMPELCFAGWAVPVGEAHAEWTPQGSFMFVPRVGAIAERLEWAYRQSGSESLRAKAREGALAYDADRVTREHWAPVLADIARGLSAPVEVAGPLARAA